MIHTGIFQRDRHLVPFRPSVKYLSSKGNHQIGFPRGWDAESLAVIPDVEKQIMDTVLDPVTIMAQHHAIGVQTIDMVIVQFLQALDLASFEVFPVFCFVHQGYSDVSQR